MTSDTHTDCLDRAAEVVEKLESELGAVENCIKLLNGEIPENIVTDKYFE